MKSKLTRIMGVALALVLVCSLGVAFMPSSTPGTPETAEAADLGWSNIPFPSDNTVWACINDDVTPAAPLVYKSTNGGYTWSACTALTGVTAAYSAIALVPSPQYATDSTIFVAVQDPVGGAATGRVFRSTNGGSSFGQLGVVTLAGGEVITSMDVAPNYDGTGTVVVGCADIATIVAPAAAATCVQIWGSNNVLSWTGLATGLAAPEDVVAVKYSPNFSLDSTILAVSALNAAQPQLRAIVGGTWDSGITATNTGATALTTGYASVTGTATDIIYADIALPSDYNGQVSTLRRAYVTFADGSANGYTAAGGNVYRITNVTAGTVMTSGVALSNIDYNGTFGEGTLIGGLYAAAATQADVYRTTNPTSAVVNWYGVSGRANQPTGTSGATVNTTAFVVMSTDFANDATVIVGTQGNDSAFGISTSGATAFNERGLIDNGSAGGAAVVALAALAPLQLGDIQLSPDYANNKTLFLISDNRNAVTYDTNAWVSYDGAAHWDRCFTFANTLAAGLSIVATSNEFGSDSVAYVGDSTGTAIFYTANAGQSWSQRACSVGIQTIAAPDAATVYVGENGGTGRIAKSTNSGWTWPTALRKATGCTTSVMDLKVDGSTLLAGGTAGTVRRSDDGGTTWSKVSATIAGNMYVDFTGGTVYAAAGGTGQTYRSVDGGGWTTLTIPTAGFIPALAVELILAEDGSLYMCDSTAVVAATSDSVWRCIGPTAAEPSPGTTWQNVATIPAAAQAWNMSVVSGSNTIAVLIDAGGGAVADSLRMYNDTLSAGTAGPTLVSPADGSTLGRGQATRFTIEAMSKVTAYSVRWATDPTLTSGWTPLAIAAPAVQTATQAGLPDGVTIYWKARATAPFNSPWSEVWSFETELATAVVAPVPAYPAGDDVMDIALKPVFNWGAFKYASGYEFQLAKDSGMTDLLVDLSGDSALGLITSYVLTDPLDYSSTYYWRVRASKGTSTAYSDWSAIVGFVTMAEPEEAAPPIIIEPTPAPAPAPAPSTPGYIWAIIAIGAVLVIVVIVLIVRTRRIA